MKVADMNNDGKVDLVAVGTYGLNVMLGNGNGSFQIGIGNVFYNSTALAVGDFNRDGKQDVVINGYNNGIWILNGDGTGRAIGGNQYSPVGGQGLFAGDINADGKTDLAVTNYYGSSTVQIFLGNGNGTLLNESTYPSNQSAYSIILSDLNNDSMPDMVVGQTTSQDLRIFINQFARPSTQTPTNTSTPTRTPTQTPTNTPTPTRTPTP